MNTPLGGGTGAGVGKFLPDFWVGVLIQPTSPWPPERIYSLELLVDRAVPTGDATLYIHAVKGSPIINVYPGPGYPVGFVEHRSFVHPYMSYPNTFGAFGWALAIPNLANGGGNGPVTVMVQDFRIYALGGRDLLADLLAWLLSGSWGGVFVTSMVRAVRSRMIHWAFQDAPQPQRPGQWP